jgi:2-polyprenyl-3-methyl-5-hydroxy-6-metoxy-1,4-benzoquinol methylase
MSVQTDPTYALGRSDVEYERLTTQAALIRPMTERLLFDAGIGPGQRVLDVGSGVGDVAFLTADLVGPAGEVVGVDIDRKALETARRRADLLGYRNVSFVEGDARTADLGQGFDATVGRLVLLYVADPSELVHAVADRVRPGGVVAFQELDMDPAVSSRSTAAATLWDETGHRVVETFVRAGTRVRVGRELLSVFLNAGLPAPEVREETLIGGGPEFGGYGWLAGVARSLAPLMQRFGIATTSDLGIETLADRIRVDALTRQALVWSPPFIGAFARRSTKR